VCRRPYAEENNRRPQRSCVAHYSIVRPPTHSQERGSPSRVSPTRERHKRPC
jgi:hypothetical protein